MLSLALSTMHHKILEIFLLRCVLFVYCFDFPISTWLFLRLHCWLLSRPFCFAILSQCFFGCKIACACTCVYVYVCSRKRVEEWMIPIFRCWNWSRKRETEIESWMVNIGNKRSNNNNNNYNKQVLCDCALVDREFPKCMTQICIDALQMHLLLGCFLFSDRCFVSCSINRRMLHIWGNVIK